MKKDNSDSPVAGTSLLDHLFDGVLFLDDTSRILSWSLSATRITGYSPEEMKGSLFPGEKLGLLDHRGRPLKVPSGIFESDLIFLRHKDGHRLPVHLKAVPGLGSPGGSGIIFREHSSKLEVEKTLKEWEQKSVLDHLTRLPNRNFMSQFLSGKIQEFITARQVFGVLFMDVDGFSQINTRWGQDAGDRLLRAIGQTLAINLRPGDMVSRWGGEEFFAVLAVKDGEDCKSAGQKFVTLVRHTAVEAGTSLAQTTISVGATLINTGDDLSSLVVRADKLMQLSKKAGKNRVTFL